MFSCHSLISTIFCSKYPINASQASLRAWVSRRGEKTCQIGSIWSNRILSAFSYSPPIFHTSNHHLAITDNQHRTAPTFNSSLLSTRPKDNVRTAEMPMSLERSHAPDSLLSSKSTSFNCNSPNHHHTQQRDAIKCNAIGWWTWLLTKWGWMFVNMTSEHERVRTPGQTVPVVEIATAPPTYRWPPSTPRQQAQTTKHRKGEDGTLLKYQPC